MAIRPKFYAKAAEFVDCIAKEISIMTMETTYPVGEAYELLYVIAECRHVETSPFVAYRWQA